jgi:hypothetical protein
MNVSVYVELRHECKPWLRKGGEAVLGIFLVGFRPRIPSQAN